MPPIALMLAAGLAIAAGGARSASLPTSFAKEGDPERWYKPASTAELRYDNAMREARSAFNEALGECRASGKRKPCAAQARARYRKDVEYAKSLRPTRLLG